jgi:hypothetical protein
MLYQLGPSEKKFVVAVLCLLGTAGCDRKSNQQTPSPDSVANSRTASTPSPDSPRPTQAQQQDCLDAAKKALGEDAKVLRCGALNTPDIQEVIAVLPAGFPSNESTGIAVRKMLILRKEPSGWRTALTAEREIQNEAGFVGIDYIDDSFHYFGYWLVLSDKRSDGAKAMDIDLLDIENADGTSEALSTEIAWNPAVGRYQEWAYNRNPEGFRPEIKSPSHRKPGVKLPTASPK